MMQANAGSPELEDGRAVYRLTPEAFADGHGERGGRRARTSWAAAAARRPRTSPRWQKEYGACSRPDHARRPVLARAEVEEIGGTARGAGPVNGFLDQFAAYFQHYGYWTVAVALMLENAGIPVPGESTLIAASVFAQARGTFNLRDIIIVATLAATMGDNLGYAIGRWGGRPLLERYRQAFHLRPETLHRGERLFARYGSVTVFLARFIVGLRVFAGPLAGALHMHWPRFVIFNALGALTWVTVVASVSYAFGRHVPALIRSIRTANLLLLVAVVLAAVFFGKKLLARLGPDD